MATSIWTACKRCKDKDHDDWLFSKSVDCEQLEECEEFCYLGSVVTGWRLWLCDRNWYPLAKSNVAVARLSRTFASNRRILCMKVKIRLCESLVLSMLLYCAETWSLKRVNGKKLKASHHRWLKFYTSREKIRSPTIRSGNVHGNES